MLLCCFQNNLFCFQSVPINKVLVAMGSCLQIVNTTAKTCVPDSVETVSLGEFILLFQASIPFIDHPKFDSFQEKLNQIMNEGQDKVKKK